MRTDPISSESLVQASVLYRDSAVIVLNKPAGIAVHRTPKGDECLEDYFSALRFGAARNPALAHRLDKETSGCLVLGREAGALTRLGKLFQTGRIAKRYLALVQGEPEAAHGVFSRPIVRIDLGRGKWEFRCTEDGQEAHTEYTILERSAGHSILGLVPLTGRTHQLRLHCQAMGCPIQGDAFYGDGVGALMLHAYQVMIPPGSGQPCVEVTAPLPEPFLAALSQNGMAVPQPITLVKAER